MLVFVGVFLLTATHDGHFLEISFEVASAFGSVSLSRGYTAELSEFGRGVIIAIKFLGRVGPLTLGFFLATRVAPACAIQNARSIWGEGTAEGRHIGLERPRRTRPSRRLARKAGFNGPASPL